MRLLTAAVLSAPILLVSLHSTPVNKKYVRTVAIKDSVAVTPTTPTQPTQTQPEQPAPAPTPVVSEPISPVTGSHEDWMTQAGISQNDWPAVDYIVSHESTWNYLAVNSEGATGLCQALPGYKMASIAPDYLTNPVTQLEWCTQYAVSRYGGWWAAYNVWIAQSWW